MRSFRRAARTRLGTLQARYAPPRLPLPAPVLTLSLSIVPIGYGIRKLQMTVVIEDELVGLDDLQEKLATDFEEYIQSSDIQAMQKL